MYYEDYLAHYGILGMHWGIRRFQNKDGSLTAAGRKRAGIGDKTGNARHKPSNAKKLAKQRISALEKARKAKAEKKEFEANKKNALERGNASEVLKFKGSLSNQELQTALTRINLEKQLSQIATADTKSTWDKINSATDKMGRMISLTSKGIEAWNTFAKISNSFSENKLPTIGGDNKKDGPDDKEKFASIINYMTKNGSLDQVLKYYPDMSKTQLSEALARYDKSAYSDDEKKRVAAVRNAIIDFGPDKKVFSVIDDWTLDEVERYRRRKEKEKEKET